MGVREINHGRRQHWEWIPVGAVRRFTDSEWDIWEYWR